MKEIKKIELVFEEYENAGSLSSPDTSLLEAARLATGNAYAPYSHYHVGAAALLATGQVVTGANQENASSPAGICAERVLLSTLASQFPGVPVSAIAISYDNKQGISDHPISPCGICRQSLLEYETRLDQPIRIILGGLHGKIIVLKDAKGLLPLGFTKEEMI